MTTALPVLDLQRLGPWGRTLTVAPPQDGARALPAAALLTGPALEETLRAYAKDLGTDRLAVAASAWSKDHAKAVLPGPVAAWVFEHLGVDASPERVHLHLERHTPRALRLLEPERSVAGPLGRDLLVDSLFGAHLAPLYRRLHEVSGIGLHVLWGNAGNLLAYFFDRFAESIPDNPRVIILREALLERHEVSWAEKPNPLSDPVWYETLDLAAGPTRVQVRRTCCLRHALPETSACTSCPILTREERLELFRSLETRA